MARLDDNLRAALGYWWNLVSDAARSGFTVTETVSIANNIAKELGETISFKQNQAISQLYSYARKEVNASSVFTAAQYTSGITSEMIATPPYARDINEQNTYPMYHVKFTYEYLDQAGNVQTGIRTSVFNNQLPGTVGELIGDIQDDAEAMAAKYGHTLLSANPFSILAV